MEPDATQHPHERQQALADIREILDAQRFAALSTSADGQPYASLVAFSATADGRRILFCTPRSTRKYANLSRNRQVALLVHTSRNAPADCSSAMAVTATGTAAEVPNDQKRTQAAPFLTKHPALAAFVNDPNTALLAVKISQYHLVRNFQNMVRIPMD